MKKNTTPPSGADALLEAHPLVIKAKKWAKKLKREISSQAAGPILNLMRAQEIVCRQMGFDSLHALRSHCLNELFPQRASGGPLALSLWPDTRQAPRDAWLMGRSASGLQARADQGAIRHHTLCAHATGADSGIPLALALEAISRGLGLTWIGASESEAEALRQRALELGRGADVRHVSPAAPKTGGLAQRSAFSSVLTGSSGSITEMVVGLAAFGESDASRMWLGRAISLLFAVIMALAFLRDTEGKALSFESIREHLRLERVIALSQRPGMPAHVQHALVAYLKSLPGFRWGAPIQAETPREQHGYLQMQFEAQLADLCEPSCFFSDEPGALSLDELTSDSPLIYIIEAPASSNPGPFRPGAFSLLAQGAVKIGADSRFRQLSEGKAQALDPSAAKESAPEPLRRLISINQAALCGALCTLPAPCRALGLALCVDVSIEDPFERQDELRSLALSCSVRALDALALSLADPESPAAKALIEPGEVAFSVFFGSERLELAGKG